MVRIEEDKEDLIRDATALVERVEIQCHGSSVLITIGVFRDGRCAVYFDQDPFYQFDQNGRLRRAYEAGYLFRSQQSTLSRINRRRDLNVSGDTEKVVLERTDLCSDELLAFAERMRTLIQDLLRQIENKEYQLLRAVTPDGRIPDAALPLLHSVLQHDEDFIAEPAGTR